MATDQELANQRMVMELELKSLQIILQKLDAMADKLPDKLMRSDVVRNTEECVRIQQTYVVLKETIPNIVSKVMNSGPERPERWSFWQWLKGSNLGSP